MIYVDVRNPTDTLGERVCAAWATMQFPVLVANTSATSAVHSEYLRLCYLQYSLLTGHRAV